MAATDEQKKSDGIDLVADVMLGEPGGATFNTVVLGGTDVVIPLERDAHADPFQDDEVWLRSVDGGVERRLCSNDDCVDEDEETGLLMYRFAHVPYGVYSVLVVSAGVAVETLRELVVRREGVFLGEKQLPDAREGKPMAPPPTDEDSENEELAAAPLDSPLVDSENYIDQEDNDEDDHG